MYYFIDFDGTILDVSTKFYNTYTAILTEHNQPILDKHLYWELKRNKTSEEIIRKVSGATLADFSNKRKKIIETDSYQKYDYLHEGVVEVLKNLKDGYVRELLKKRNPSASVLITQRPNSAIGRIMTT